MERNQPNSRDMLSHIPQRPNEIIQVKNLFVNETTGKVLSKKAQ
jgi:hypothetical protein